MARKYSQIRYGSQGDDVRTLQETLNGNGYKLDLDGNFGPKTEAAVKDYQQKTGLTVDGIVGDKTWGSLTGFKPKDEMAVSTMGASGTQQPASAADMEFSYDDYVESETVTAANQMLQDFMANQPGAWEDKWAAQLEEIMGQITGRDKFTYDLNKDALYQQYADQYAQMGKMAMMDTMGQAAAMTGGYGSSYGQSVGQQAYQSYLQQLNEVVPELYGMAYDQYQQEGQDLLNQYSLLSSERDQDYGVYRDKVSDYYTELQRLTEDARYKSEDEYGRYLDDRNLAYDEFSEDRAYKYQQERDTEADAQWAKEFEFAQKQYNDSLKASGGSGGSGSSGSTKPYEMPPDEFAQWRSMWADVESEADAEALAESMEAAGVPFDLVAIWYKEYTGGYLKDDGPTNTNVPQTVKLPKGGGGGRLGGGPVHVKQ